MSTPDTQAGTGTAAPDLYAAARTTVAHAEQLNEMLRAHAVVVRDNTAHPALAAHNIPGVTR